MYVQAVVVSTYGMRLCLAEMDKVNSSASDAGILAMAYHTGV